MKVFAGLTGGIGSGKTIVSNEFFKLGADIIDTDILSRNVVEKGSEGDAALRQSFPFAYCDGVLDRSKLRKAVFEDNAMLEKLNSITHPLIANEAKKLMNESKKQVVVLVAPLLFESGFNKLTKPNITISGNIESRIKRIIKRDNITEELARKMISSQFSDLKREASSDIIIFNDGTVESLLKRVREVYKHLEFIANRGN